MWIVGPGPNLQCVQETSKTGVEYPDEVCVAHARMHRELMSDESADKRHCRSAVIWHVKWL